MKAARILVLIAGICLLVLAPLVGLLGIVVGVAVPSANRLMMVTLGTSVAVLGAGFGGLLAWHAWRSGEGRPSRPFQPHWPALGIAVFLLALGLGQLLVGQPPFNLVLFPPFHILAAALPPLIILGFVGRSLKGVVRWREVVLQVSSGAILAVSVAMVVEVTLLVALAILAALLAVALGGGSSEIQSLALKLQDPAQTAALARSPWVWVGVLTVVSGAVPLVEETVKTVGIGLMSHRRPGPDRAYLWGLAGGAGFALTESTLNGAAGLSAWAPLLALRVGATLMHCITGAIMGLAWYGVLQRRLWRSLGLYAICLTIHGAWNAVSVAASLLPPADSNRSVATMLGLGSPAGIVLTSLLGVMALGAALGLVALTRYVRARSLVPAGTSAEGTPLQPQPLVPETGGALPVPLAGDLGPSDLALPARPGEPADVSLPDAISGSQPPGSR